MAVVLSDAPLLDNSFILEAQRDDPFYVLSTNQTTGLARQLASSSNTHVDLISFKVIDEECQVESKSQEESHGFVLSLRLKLIMAPLVIAILAVVVIEVIDSSGFGSRRDNQVATEGGQNAIEGGQNAIEGGQNQQLSASFFHP